MTEKIHKPCYFFNTGGCYHNDGRIKTDNVYYRWPLVILALILFIIELFVRRINENKLIYGAK